MKIITALINAINRFNNSVLYVDMNKKMIVGIIKILLIEHPKPKLMPK